MIRVFVSSPGDVAEERHLVREVLESINATEGARRGFRLEQFTYERDVVPQIGPPAQEVIDRQTPEYAIYVGIMGARFGTPTGEYLGGTEAEFREAYAQWSQLGRPWITFYFKDEAIRTHDPATAEQYARVARFRSEVQTLGLARSYSQTRGSEDSFFELLSADLRRLLWITLDPRPPRPRILFTSTSARRKALLEQIGWREKEDFVMVAASVNPEESDTNTFSLEAAKKRALDTAREKIRYAVEVMRSVEGHSLNRSESVVFGVDTIVLCEGTILDNPLTKALDFAGPEDLKQAHLTAIEMLSRQSGKTISVITGLVVALADDLRKYREAAVVTNAKMRRLSRADIEAYVGTKPFDKAGGFGIQDQGVSLFEGIEGSYSNVVGLPLTESCELLRDPLFRSRIALPSLARRNPPEPAAGDAPTAPPDKPSLSLVSVGDINYDFIYNELDEGFFARLQPPGEKVSGEVRRAAGGTAVTFAKGARMAGFEHCAVVGVVGGDPLGSMIEQELNQAGLVPLLPRDNRQRTSVAIVLRDRAERDTSITLTDARQALPPFVVDRAASEIKAADVLYVSGYCLTDRNRQETARRMLELARKSGTLTVLDVVVGMSRRMRFEHLVRLCTELDGQSNVDVLVSELPEILEWLEIAGAPEDTDALFELVKQAVLPKLHRHFKTVFLRTKTYSHELVSSPWGISGPYQLDYSREKRRLGYGDRLTSRHIYDYLSPRVVLASRSPQRLELMNQIVAPNKLQVLVSNDREDVKTGEQPEARVRRLALAKARRIYAGGNYADTIEVIIGADTEAVLPDQFGNEHMFGHPATADEARSVLAGLSSREFSVLTGIALVGRPVGGAEGSPPKEVVDCVRTKVRFRRLSREEIEDYIASGEPFGRAGAFAIQGRGALLVDSIEGSYSNVVGLPLERLCALLAGEFGMPIWDIDKVSKWRFPQPLARAYAQAG